MNADAKSALPGDKAEAVDDESPPDAGDERPVRGPEKRPQENTIEEAREGIEDIPELRPSLKNEDVDATPMPEERSILNPKTPVVTGAWVDTPGPRTLQKNAAITSRSRSRSPVKRSPQKARSSTEQTASTAEESRETAVTQVVRPQLPTSALQALVSEAKSSGRRPSADFGDSTINSLEELITDAPDAAVDEDTLQGLQLPTATPRNEAERQRQQELLHLHRMNDRLRAARTSIRDASRGMKRVEDRVEHVEEDAQGNKIHIIRRECPCATAPHPQDFSLWRWSKSFIWQDHLKALRMTSNSTWRIWGGLTGLGIFLTLFLAWWLSEEIACEIYCHHAYAYSSPYPFSVNMDAPIYPFVIPTLIYRHFIKAWWVPLYSCLSWLAASLFGAGGEDRSMLFRGAVEEGVRATATASRYWVGESHGVHVDEMDWDLGMEGDEKM